MAEGMYTGKSALDWANSMGSAGQATMNKTQPNIPMPEKTIAGGAMSGLGGAGAGAAIATALSASTPVGWGLVATGALTGLA